MDGTTGRGRVHLLDELRGMAILLMIVDHMMYDGYFLLGFHAIGWWFRQPMLSVRSLFAVLFLLISGIACRYSHSNMKRGALCFGLGMVITLVTWIVAPDQLILFGILHAMGLSMLLVGMFGKLFDRLPPLPGMILMLILSLLSWDIRFGRFGIPGIWQVEIPASFYQFDLLSPLGFPSPGFHSADYFPLMPFFFVFLMGFYLGVYFKKGKMPAWTYASHSRTLGLIGRHTLIIYLLHQPILYGITLLLLQLQ